MAICVIDVLINDFQHKVKWPNSVNYLNQTPIFEWCLLRCDSKNRHQKGIMSSGEIGLRVQNLLTTLGSIVNIIGEARITAVAVWTFKIHSRHKGAQKKF